MAELKKHKRFYFILFAIIIVAFLFIFRYLAVIKGANKIVASEIYLLYFFNIVLIISISLFYFIFIRFTRKENQEIQNLPGDRDGISSDEEQKKEQNIIYEKEITELLRQLGNTLSFEKTKDKMFEAFLKIVVKQTESVQAALFLTVEKEDKKILRFTSGYAFFVPETELFEFYFGEGLNGQVAIDKKLLNLSDIKVDRTPVYSGMGSSVPQNLIICPLLNNNETIGVIELASFRKYDMREEQFVEKATLLLSGLIAKINNY